MDQTPVHEIHNPDLLSLIPKTSQRLIEIGCSSGALAREFKKINPQCDYLGVEVSAEYAELAKRYCDDTLTLDLEVAGEEFYRANALRDCWIFGDTLEHFKDPWTVLKRIRKIIPGTGSVVACIPNAQHWSVQVKLAIGDFRYTDKGLFDRTHLRWFTRQTIVELFAETGYQLVQGVSRVSNTPENERVLHSIREMAKVARVDPDVAANDSLPIQHVVRATPV